jgi:uncharacterized protein (TIGR02594 family)
MTASSYDEALERVLVHEGGYTNHSSDPGGPTNFGITIHDARAHWKKDATAADVRGMPLAVAKEIYRSKYWDALRCDDLPAGVDYAVFDYGVNSGIARSAKVLQRFVGADVDGEIGPETIAAAVRANAADLIGRICDERLTFLQGLSTWSVFGKGWGRRVREVRAAALAMVAAKPAAPQPAIPAPAPAKPSQSVVVSLIQAAIGLFRSGTAPAAHGPAASARAAPTAPAEPPWLAAARKDIGFHEVGTNRGIEKFIASAKCGSVGDPWCAIFVNAKLEDAGIRGSRSAMARSFEHDPNFVKLAGPALGAIGTLWRGSPSSGSGHVFLYVGENENGVLGIAGNQSDGVRRAYQDRSRIAGYFWPKSAPLPKTGKILISVNGQTAHDLVGAKET